MNKKTLKNIFKIAKASLIIIGFLIVIGGVGNQDFAMVSGTSRSILEDLPQILIGLVLFSVGIV